MTDAIAGNASNVPRVHATGVGVARAALSAAAVTIPHAVGLGLLAYAPLAGSLPVAALALWSAALPGAVAALFAGRAGVVHAPTTVVALLYAAIVSAISASAPAMGMSALQVLAACGGTVALGFAFQWMFGALRLASLARFLPVSVMHGFAAGVGLSMLIGQVKHGFGLGHWVWSPQLALHALAALAVVAAGRYLSRKWPRWPGLLPGVAGVTLIIWATGLAGAFTPAAPASTFALPPLPDYSGVPWIALVQQHGVQLVSLALLMAVVNSLDVLVFNQELELQHGLRVDPNAALRRESLVGVVCGACGLIPASTSASRTRIVMREAGPSTAAGTTHAALLLFVAVSGYLWLSHVPMAALSGALLLAGFTQVPIVMWSRDYKRAAPDSWLQSWLVALVFSAVGGAGALLAGLVVATFLLLHASASNALRRAHLNGEVRSRRLRRSSSEAWVAPRMNSVAVIELQGVMSFGVAAHMAEQVRTLLEPRHDKVIIAAHRVPTWDTTALVQLNALGRDLAKEGRQLAVCGLDARAAVQVNGNLHQFADLDRGLEWAEDAILAQRDESERQRPVSEEVLGELGEGIDDSARADLLALMNPIRIEPGERLFSAGDAGRDLFIVEAGLVTMSTAWPPHQGLRLATIGKGMAFGEMAFLNAAPRTACAGADAGPVGALRLSRVDFDSWTATHPRAAVIFMSNLALIGTRRLAATTRQLRAVLE